VVECKSTNDAPKGDCFYVLVQLCGVHRVSGQSQLRISMRMCFHKPCLGKGMIQAGAESDARRSWTAMVASLQRHIAATGLATALSTGAAAAPALPPAEAASCAKPNLGGAPHRPGMVRRRAVLTGQRSGSSAATVLILSFVLLALCALSLAVWQAGSVVSADLRELTAAVREATAAGCGLHPGVPEAFGALEQAFGGSNAGFEQAQNGWF